MRFPRYFPFSFHKLDTVSVGCVFPRTLFDEQRVPRLAGDAAVLHDIHCVSSVLKLYFRQLPTPLVTYDLYPHLVLASKQSEPRRGEKYREILQRLPGAHYRSATRLVLQTINWRSCTITEKAPTLSLLIIASGTQFQCLKCKSASKCRRFQPEEAFSVIVKTDCESEGSSAALLQTLQSAMSELSAPDNATTAPVTVGARIT